MDEVKSEKQRLLDRLWREKESVRGLFNESDLSKLGDAVFLNGCWSFRPLPPLHKASLGLNLDAVDLSQIGKAEKEELSIEAAKKRNEEYERLLESKQKEIDEFFQECNQRWSRYVELWEVSAAGLDGLNPQLVNTRRIVRLNDLLGHVGQEPKVIVDSLLSKTWIALLAGASKSNKSWLSLQLAIAVSRGEEWLGFRCRPSRVLYIDYELSTHSLRKRLTKLGLSRESPNHGPDFLILKGGGKEGEVARILRLMKESQGQKILDLGFGEGDEEVFSDENSSAEKVEEDYSDIYDIYDLIILDPLYMLLGNRDENNARDMVKVFNEIRKLQSSTGAAILINTHFRKGIRDFRSSSADRISGSGVFARYPDVIMTIERSDEGVSQKLKEKLKNRYRMDFTVRHLKPPEPRTLQLVEETHSFITVKDHELKEGRDIVQIEPARRGRKSKSAKLILDGMKRKAKKLNNLPLAEAVPLIAAEAGVGKSTVYRFLKNKNRYLYKRGNKLIVDLSKFDK